MNGPYINKHNKKIVMKSIYKKVHDDANNQTGGKIT